MSWPLEHRAWKRYGAVLSCSPRRALFDTGFDERAWSEIAGDDALLQNVDGSIVVVPPFGDDLATVPNPTSAAQHLRKAVAVGRVVTILLPSYGDPLEASDDLRASRQWADDVLSALTGFEVQSATWSYLRRRLADRPCWLPPLRHTGRDRTRPELFDPLFSVPLPGEGTPAPPGVRLHWNHSVADDLRSSLFWAIDRGRVEALPMLVHGLTATSDTERSYVIKQALTLGKQTMGERTNTGRAAPAWRVWDERGVTTTLPPLFDEPVDREKFDVISPLGVVKAGALRNEACELALQYDLVVDLENAIERRPDDRGHVRPYVYVRSNGEMCLAKKKEECPSGRAAGLLGAWIRHGLGDVRYETLGDAIWRAYNRRNDPYAAALPYRAAAQLVSNLRTRLPWVPFEKRFSKPVILNLTRDRALAVIDSHGRATSLNHASTTRL